MCSQTRLRAALGHLRPKSNKPGGLFDGWHLDGAAAVDVEVDESAEFPVGFPRTGRSGMWTRRRRARWA